jgi:hypothetical protein
MNSLTLNIYRSVIYSMYLQEFVVITNLVLVFTCKALGSTLENSKEKGSFENWYTANELKLWGGWLLAVGMRCRVIFASFVELLILFEYLAIILVINREKDKSL